MSIKSAEIICVGTELLMGQTLNTNSRFLARELASLGIPSYRQIVVGDNYDRLYEQIKESAGRSDLVILTGGLGPTTDDITMGVAADVAGKELVFDEESFNNITEYFRRLFRNMPKNNRKQAMLPEGATILKNNNGTAPGAMFEYSCPTTEDPDRVVHFVLLPGPPSEMSLMFTNEARPILEKMSDSKFITKFVHLFGIGESAAAERISDLIDAQTNPTIAPYASEGECMFRVTQRVDNGEEEKDLITPILDVMKERFGQCIYEIGDRPLKQVAYDLLLEKNKTVCFAESCTAGMVSSEFVDIPGASQVFMGSVVSYGNKVKTNLLGVSDDVLENLGAVSRECAQEMAEGARKLLGTDIAVSITGIAGPTGESAAKPVGLVYLAIADEKGTDVIEVHLSGNRSRVRHVAVLHAFNLIRMRLS
ncbi:MAG: competence/damage-inducible protein A [Saccharofermentanaceae bacterium]|nr:competence/damage-inducible protein A [Saccharofermentanaceae bacterium]HAU50797.1 competence/damage-inducible protein A [Clostridiales bacterium]HBZ77562.1 competence/damage-inducible protein A [Clostridiales bacterium]